MTLDKKTSITNSIKTTPNTVKQVLLCGAGLDTLCSKLVLEKVHKTDGNDNSVTVWSQNILPIYVNYHGRYCDAELIFVKRLFGDNLIVLDVDLTKLKLELNDDDATYIARGILTIILTLAYCIRNNITINRIMLCHSKDDAAPDTVETINKSIDFKVWSSIANMYCHSVDDHMDQQCKDPSFYPSIVIESPIENMSKTEVWDTIKHNCTQDYVLSHTLSCYKPHNIKTKTDVTSNDCKCNKCKACLRYNTAMHYMYDTLMPFERLDLLLTSIAKAKNEDLRQAYNAYYKALMLYMPKETL